MPNIIVLIITASLSTLLFLNFEKESRDLKTSAEQSGIIQSRLIQVDKLFTNLEYIILASRFESKDVGLGRIPQIIQEIQNHINALEINFFTSRGQRHLYDIRQGILKLNETELIEAIRSKDEQRIKISFDKLLDFSRKLESTLDDLNTVNIRRLFDEFENLRARHLHFGVALAFVMFIFASMIIFVSWYFYRIVIQPIETLTQAARQISEEENIVPVIFDQRKDEIGYLARAFNQMTSNLIKSNSTLKQTIDSRDQFISIASHELKTPLTTLSLQMQLLSNLLQVLEIDLIPNQTKKKIENSVSLAQKQIQRLIRLVNELLDITRIQAGILQFNFNPVNLSILIQEVIEKMSKDLEAAHSSIHLDLAPSVIGNWDASRLEQVLVNLLSNAMKYARGSPVEIVTRQEGDQASWIIRDFGPGIPKEKQAHLFEKFERAVGPVASTEGLGLGLYITKHIVEGHHGTIDIQSEPGVGTQFVIQLPLFSV